MNALIDAALGHARTVLLTLVLILVAGTVAYVEIPKEADPDINIPIIYVSITHEGISPEDAERLLIRPMEKEMRGIDGVKKMTAKGYEGGANVTLEFEAGFNADQALTDVREKVDLAKPELPDDTDEPSVNEVNFSLFPVIAVTLSGDVPERLLLKLARDLRDKIEAVSAVLSAQIAGDREELLEILIDPIKLESYNLSPVDTVQLVEASNKLVAAGAQDTGQGRFSLKVPGLFETLTDIVSMPVAFKGDAVVTFGDIGEVRRGFKDPEGFARIHGERAIVLEVVKRTGENIIDTIEAVRQVVAQEQAGWPEEVRRAVTVDFIQDKSIQIRTMLLDLQNNVTSAILLVMVVVVAALGLRSAGLVGLAIPGSFLTAILVLSAMGLTVNIVVLFSLILAVGMLVDGAIVVTEYADRKMTEGAPPKLAYGLAAKRMAWPITASTATTLAAFLPLLFWPGVVGEFMKFLPITLLMTLAASLLMALIFVPTLGAVFGRAGGTGDAETAKRLAAVSEDEDNEGTGSLEGVGGLTGMYLMVLRGALSHPVKVLAGSVLLLIVVQVGYAKFGHGVEFFPDVEPELAQLQVRARGNLSAWEQDKLMREVEDRILDMREFKSIYTRTGKNQQSQEAEDIIGTITLEFAEWTTRRTADEILNDVEKRTHDLAGIHVDRRKQEKGPPVGKPVNVELTSRLPELLPAAVQKVLEGINAIGGLINVEDGRQLPGIDWEVQVDRAQAAKFGANVQLIGRMVQTVTTGINVGEYRPDDSDDEIDIRVRYPAEFRTLEQLYAIKVNTANGPVPIRNFVTITPKPKIGTLSRSDGKRVLAVKADVAPGVQAAEKLAALKVWIAQANLDPNIGVDFKGEDEEQAKAEAFLSKAFSAALFIMAIILVTQFNSFYSAFLILSAVIMSTIGVFIGLMVTAQPFGIVMTGIGVIALAGIVVNNNIVLIDTFDRLAKTATDMKEAILRTGAQRLRPVLLTSVTTVLGLMPMVLGMNIDFVNHAVTVGAPSTQWWRSLATAIVFGLAFATVLTLIVTPAALMVRANFQAWRAGRRAGNQPQAAE
ncbi:efflux RND transporter permease subunit [Thalassospiraceae bacterium LMO-SO8]|nr:efflux RND transporter permease subunit [Alphaproteobacteria bacterium LMO-S08]WND76229.1 efflux RND transporter permease subunit [Thalassospiraceae bacterium LMO-SO8]